MPDGLTEFVDQLNKPLLMKKTEELLNSSTNISLESNMTSSSSSVRRNRMLTDTVSAPSPTLDTKVSVTSTTPIANTSTATCASNTSVNTISTNDGTNSASSLSIKSKQLIETIVPITLEYLCENKNFLKLKHKQDKELVLMKKKHAKEQALLGEQQSKIMSKAKTDSEKLSRSPMIQVANQRRDLRYYYYHLDL